MSAACPICNKPATKEYTPFCSKRCSDQDLGHWLKGTYAVPAEEISPDNDVPDDEEDF